MIGKCTSGSTRIECNPYAKFNEINEKKSKETNNIWEKHIPQKETSKRKESTGIDKNSDDSKHSKKGRIKLMDSNSSFSRIETPINKRNKGCFFEFQCEFSLDKTS